MLAPALDTRRPFTRADGLAAGLSAKQLRCSGFRAVLRGVYVDAAVSVSPRLRVEAALCLFDPTAFASHASAARVLALPIPTIPAEHVTVTQPGHRRRTAGVRCHVTAAAEVTEVDGVRVSAPRQLFVELATLLPLVDLVVVGDAMVRRGLVTPSALVAWCADSSAPGTAAAREAAGYVRERVDSPMETRLRMLLVLAGLPEPEINLTIRTHDGAVIRRYDLCWPHARVIVEYDGRQHVERIDQWEADLARREAIDEDQWRILVVVSRGIYGQPGDTVHRVFRVLAARRLPGLPTRPRDDWRPHFPSRD